MQRFSVVRLLSRAPVLLVLSREEVWALCMAEKRMRRLCKSSSSTALVWLTMGYCKRSSKSGLLAPLINKMPPKAQPKIYQLLFKTHKLTILLTTPPNTTIASLKMEVFSALSSDVNQVENVPKVTSEKAFEISRAVKDRGKKTLQYEVLERSQTVKDTLTNWEVLFLQFRDRSGKSIVTSLIPSSTLPLVNDCPCLYPNDNFKTMFILSLLVEYVGNLLPVEVTQPSLLDEDDEEPPKNRPTPELLPGNKGKRKAPEE